MTVINQAQRSPIAAIAAFTATAAISVSALAAGPLVSNYSWKLAASSLPAGIASAIHDVLVATHTAVQADRVDIVADRQDIRATRRDSVQAIGASIVAGAIGEGQIVSILDDAHAANNAARQSISASGVDIHQTRQAAAADIRDIIAGTQDPSAEAQLVVAGTRDGSIAQDVRAIIDTAKMDNAMTRSAIVADAQENASIRHATVTADVAVRQSARAGDISKADAAQQISATRRSAHAEIAGNHSQMASDHKQIVTTRNQAARDVAKTVHQGRTGN